ncbi:MAG: S8 family peptidase [Fimbriimonas sp.]
MKSLPMRLLALAALALMAPAALAGENERMLIVRLAPGASAPAIANRYNLKLLDRTAGNTFALFRAMSEWHADRTQILMATDARVVWAEDNAGLSAPENLRFSNTMPKKGGSVPAVGDRFKLVQVNAGYLQQINWTSSIASAPGRTVRVAVLDTGLAQTQTALWSKVVASYNAVEPGLPAFDFPRQQDSNRNGIRDEAVGHGTVVAGLVDVVSPNSKLVIARVADSDGNATAWTIVKGLAFAVAQGSEVANVSLGSLAQIPALSDTMDWCEENGLVVVAAIGNDNVREAAYPGRISKTVCVAGLDATDHKASFSNWDGKADVAAPAVGLVSQYWDGELVSWSGTSFAAPLVTGALAEYARRASGRVLPETLRNALEESVDNIDSLNQPYRKELGGRLNVTRLVSGFRRP